MPFQTDYILNYFQKNCGKSVLRMWKLDEISALNAEEIVALVCIQQTSAKGYDCLVECIVWRKITRLIINSNK